MKFEDFFWKVNNHFRTVLRTVLLMFSPRSWWKKSISNYFEIRSRGRQLPLRGPIKSPCSFLFMTFWIPWIKIIKQWLMSSKRGIFCLSLFFFLTYANCVKLPPPVANNPVVGFIIDPFIFLKCWIRIWSY